MHNNWLSGVNMSLDRPKPTQLYHWICNTSTCSFFLHVIFDKVLVNSVHNVRLKCIFVVVFGFVLFLVILFTLYSLYRKQQWSTNVDTAFRSSKFNIKLKNCHSFLAVAFFRSLLKLSNSHLQQETNHVKYTLNTFISFTYSYRTTRSI